MSAVLLALVSASAEVHPHTGTLRKYTHAPPSRYGFSLAGVADEELRQSSPVVRPIPGQRFMSVQDIHCSEDVVWKTVNDLDRYPKMVPGVTHCDTYKKKKTVTGGCVAHARYRIWSGFPLEYFVRHHFEPLKRCMTFSLDYERKSQLSDMVGYWYVEPCADRKWSRVYFSSDSAVPYWMPPTARGFMLRTVQSKNLAWVEKRCNELTGFTGVRRDVIKRRVVAAGLIGIGAWRLRATVSKRGGGPDVE